MLRRASNCRLTIIIITNFVKLRTSLSCYVLQLQRDRRCCEALHQRHPRDVDNRGNTQQVATKRLDMAQHEHRLRLLSLDPRRAGRTCCRRVSMAAVDLSRLPLLHSALRRRPLRASVPLRRNLRRPGRRMPYLAVDAVCQRASRSRGRGRADATVRLRNVLHRGEAAARPHDPRRHLGPATRRRQPLVPADTIRRHPDEVRAALLHPATRLPAVTGPDLRHSVAAAAPLRQAHCRRQLAHVGRSLHLVRVSATTQDTAPRPPGVCGRRNRPRLSNATINRQHPARNCCCAGPILAAAAMGSPLPVLVACSVSVSGASSIGSEVWVTDRPKCQLGDLGEAPIWLSSYFVNNSFT